MTRPVKSNKLIFILGLVGVIILILTYSAFRWLNQVNEIEAQLKNTFSTIKQPAQSSVIYEGLCHGTGGGGSKFATCAGVDYCAAIGSNLTSTDLENWYNQEFFNKAWKPINDHVFSISNQQQLEYLQIKSDKPLPMSLDHAAYNAIATAEKSYTLTYLMILSDRSTTNCPSGIH